MMRNKYKLILRGLFGALLITLCGNPTRAFNLEDLDKQLRKPSVVRGEFSQKKYLRGLQEPLVATGAFTLATGHGLLWHLETPVRRSLRITPKGLAYYVEGSLGSNNKASWVVDSARSQQNRSFRLFLSVLNGNTTELKKQFHLELAGAEEEWRLNLTPNSTVLRQIFSHIEILGGAQVSRIELHEAQGDYSVIAFEAVVADTALIAEETQAFEN